MWIIVHCLDDRGNVCYRQRLQIKRLPYLNQFGVMVVDVREGRYSVERMNDPEVVYRNLQVVPVTLWELGLGPRTGKNGINEWNARRYSKPSPLF